MSRDQRVSISFIQNRSHALRIEEKSAQDHRAAAHDGLPPTNCRLRDAEMGVCAARIRLITISPSLGTIGRAGGEVDDGRFKCGWTVARSNAFEPRPSPRRFGSARGCCGVVICLHGTSLNACAKFTWNEMCVRIVRVWRRRIPHGIVRNR